jgi:hypothetical protein
VYASKCIARLTCAAGDDPLSPLLLEKDGHKTVHAGNLKLNTSWRSSRLRYSWFPSFVLRFWTCSSCALLSISYTIKVERNIQRVEEHVEGLATAKDLVCVPVCKLIAALRIFYVLEHPSRCTCTRRCAGEFSFRGVVTYRAGIRRNDLT